MTHKIDYRILTPNDIPDIAVLGQQLNPKLTLEQIKTYLFQMFEFETYTCFGVFLNDRLVGISSAWTT